VKIFLPGFLLALWLLAWGEVSVGNVVSGIALIVVLFLAFPAAPRRERVRVHPIAMARLLWFVVGQIVVSNVLVAREILGRPARIQIGVIAYPVQHPSALTLTLMSNILALAPGMLPVDVTDDPPVIYVHFLLLSHVDAVRSSVARLETLVVAAVETRPTSDRDALTDGRERET
jgi:multisubunit Na+/H+ antiporter MnhE subunit